MRTLKTLFILLFFSGFIQGQTPGFINYQAALKDNVGNPLANENVSVSITFIVGGESYQASQLSTTDEFGIVNVQLGGEDVKNLDWASGDASISVSIASSKGNISLGVIPLATVPYALYAENSGNSKPGPAPKHEWEGSMLRFENSDGTFGEFVDLRGPQGNSVRVIGSVATSDDLPEGNSVEKGDMIIVSNNGDGYVWDGEMWLNLGKLQGPKGDQGPRGLKGSKPDHQWSNTQLRFERPDGTWGDFVNLKGEHGIPGEQGIQGLKGEKGEQGEQGDSGLAAEHQWQSTALRFRNPDGSWGSAIDLLGPRGEIGEKGDKPNHQWNGTSIRFENPDGSFGPYIDIKGPQGNSVTVVGSVPAPQDLPDGSQNNPGEMYIVSSTGDGYVWTGIDWLNVGQIQGPAGPVGPTGLSPEHQWSQASLRFRNPDGSWGSFTNLKGDNGLDGEDGLAPEHQWNQTSLRFRNPDGSWGLSINLKGDQGEEGDAPEHQWIQTGLRFKNPDGSWGQIVNLKGDQGNQGPQGIPGIQGEQGAQGELGSAPEHQWIQTGLRFRNPDGTWGTTTNLKGDQGNTGQQGPQGLAPEHQWNQTALRFKNPDESWGSFTNLKGEDGMSPEHQWNQTALRFRNPDGIWGQYTDLKGDPGQYTAGAGISINNGVISNTGDIDPDPKVKFTTNFNGDVSGIYNNISVDKIKGRTVASIAPQEGQVMTFQNGQWRPVNPPNSNLTLNGDVTGMSNSNTVEKIRGISVSTSQPTEGQAMIFLNGQWRPTNLPNAGGDATGPINNLTVTKIQNRNVSNTIPAEGQFMVYNNGEWQPLSPPGLGGDVSGSSSNVTVTGLRTRPVSNQTPTEGQVLTFQSGQWRPASPAPSGGSTNVAAGTIATNGTLQFATPGVSASGSNGNYSISVSGVSLNGNSCAVTATSRGDHGVISVNFGGGSANISNQAGLGVSFMIVY